MKPLAVMTMLALMAGCMTIERPLSTDLVRDEATDIRLGQEACVNSLNLQRTRKDGGWRAELHNGVWRTWPKTGACESFGTKISAATGKSDGSCAVCAA